MSSISSLRPPSPAQPRKGICPATQFGGGEGPATHGKDARCVHFSGDCTYIKLFRSSPSHQCGRPLCQLCPPPSRSQWDNRRRHNEPLVRPGVRPLQTAACRARVEGTAASHQDTK